MNNKNYIVLYIIKLMGRRRGEDANNKQRFKNEIRIENVEVNRTSYYSNISSKWNKLVI